MVSKRSQKLFNLASAPVAPVDDVAPGDDAAPVDDADANNTDDESRVSSPAPSLSTSDQRIIEDALTQVRVVKLGEEKPSDLVEKWVRTQSSGVDGSSPVVPQKKPVRIVDYSPSLTSASSRVSAESRTSNNPVISARKRKMLENIGHVFTAPAALIPVNRNVQSICKDLTNRFIEVSRTSLPLSSYSKDGKPDLSKENRSLPPPPKSSKKEKKRNKSDASKDFPEVQQPKSSQKGIQPESDLATQLDTSIPSKQFGEKKKSDVTKDITGSADNQEQYHSSLSPISTNESQPPKSSRNPEGIEMYFAAPDSPLLETPKSSRKSGTKKKKDVSKDLIQPRRSTRSRPPKRVASPDMFSDDEDCDELFADVDSDDSLVIESQSSSSSNGSDSENEKNSEIAGIGANSDKERNLEPQEKVASAQRKRNLEIAEMEDDSDEERNLVPQKKRRERKKSATNKNKLSKEERSLNSHLRNSGKKYRNYKNEEVGERQRKKPHVCTRNKCHETVTDEIGEAIFHEYWEQNSYEKRVSYVASRVETYPIKVSRPRLPAGHPKAHRKSVSHKYFFDIHGERKEVCKKTFLGTLGETDGFLMITTHKKSQSISGVNKNGKRGKHVPAHKLKQTTIEEVKQHILKFPSHKSHYKRAEVGETRYLPSHLDRRQMHQMYLQEEHTPVSYSTYERIFNTMGRSFKKPYTDTCEKCDTWKEKVKHAPDVETQEKLQEEWDAHLDRAKAAYDLKKKCKIQAESDPTLRVLIFDLEQVLETPLVSTGAAFYLRQLNTYNLTIYDTTTKLTHCYMWSEVDGKRGANEIASCIFFHCLDQIDETVKKVILFSDSTVGQNKNSILSAMFLTLVQMHCSIQSVEHVFLEAGHTRLEVDSKHSVIERKKDHVDKVNVPSDWYNLVRSIGGGNNPNRRFRVVEMAGEFYDFQSFYAGPLVRRTVTTTGDKFVWLETPLLRYDANRPGKIFFKTNLEHLAYGCLSFQRSGKAGEYSAQNLRSALKVLYKSPLPITVEKKKDLLKLLPLLPPSCHDFYKSIKTTDDPSDNDLDSD